MDTSSSSSPAPAAASGDADHQHDTLTQQQPVLDNTEAQQLLMVAANRVWEELYVCKKPVYKFFSIVPAYLLNYSLTHCHWLARMVLVANRHSDSRPLLCHPHWLPVRQCILYNMAVLTRKAHSTGAATYLNEYLVQHLPHVLNTFCCAILTVPRLTTEFDRRSFSYTAPVIWNSLPANILLCNCESSFKKHLKTFLWNSCFYSAWLTPPVPL